MLIVADERQKVLSDYDLVLSALNSDLIKVGKAITDFIKEESQSEQVYQMLMQARKEIRNKTMLSNRQDHQDWFTSGVGCSTKEEVLRRKAQDRLRGYYYKVKDEFLRSELYRKNPKAKNLLNEILEYFRYLLISVDYFSVIFDRTHSDRHVIIHNLDEIDASTRVLSKRRKLEIVESVGKDSFLDMDELKKTLCNSKGDFFCFGLWSQPNCQYNQTHVINPYSSRENLILFQTWNLDHQVELTRSVLPSLLANVATIVSGKAVCKRHKLKGIQVSVFTYFKEFFSIDNLRLVHIICHDKGTHDLHSKGTIICNKCEEFKFILRLRKIINN